MEPEAINLLAESSNTVLLALLLYWVLRGIEKLSHRILDLMNEVIERCIPGCEQKNEK